MRVIKQKDNGGNYTGRTDSPWRPEQSQMVYLSSISMTLNRANGCAPAQIPRRPRVECSLLAIVRARLTVLVVKRYSFNAPAASFVEQDGPSKTTGTSTAAAQIMPAALLFLAQLKLASAPFGPVLIVDKYPDF